MIDFLKSVMTPDLLFGILNVVKLSNNMFWVAKLIHAGSVLTKPVKTPINKLDFNIDKGDFHCDFHLSR